MIKASRLATVLVVATVSPLGVATARADADIRSLGPTPVDCAVLKKDFSDPSCTTQGSGGLAVSPHTVHAGGKLTGATGDCIIGFGNDNPCPADWSGLTGVAPTGKHSRCGQHDLSCTVTISSKAGTSSWQIVTVGRVNGFGTSISKDYFAVIGRGKRRISGTVTDEGGEALAGVGVTLSGAGRKTLKTDRTGAYAVAVDPGRYQVKLAKRPKRVACSGERRGAGCRLDVRERDGSASFVLGTAPTFDWSMPKRFGFDNDEDGLMDYFTAPGQINPAEWRVDFKVLTARGRRCDPTVVYKWEIDGEPVEMDRETPCEFSFAHFPRQRKFKVALKSREANTEDELLTTQTVLVRDFLIVAIGDSMGSGEGNPDIPAGGGQGPIWQDHRCDRSAFAFGPVAALDMEEFDDRSSVTLLHIACSGAAIEFGMLKPYPGIHPDGNEVPRQLDQIESLVGDREIDAVLMSIGINDSLFGPSLEQCSQNGKDDSSCDQQPAKSDPGRTLDEAVKKHLKRLPGLYGLLAPRLKALVEPERVYIGEYPDPTRDRKSVFCKEILGNPFGAMERAEIVWAHDNLLIPLNKAVPAAARRHGWTFVGGTAANFKPHGYCTRGNQSWTRTLSESLLMQSGPGADPSGAMHPNQRGHREIAELIGRQLQRDLFPKRKPRPPTL